MSPYTYFTFSFGKSSVIFCSVIVLFVIEEICKWAVIILEAQTFHVVVVQLVCCMCYTIEKEENELFMCFWKITQPGFVRP